MKIKVNVKDLCKAIRLGAGKVHFKLKKHAPDILFATGMVGMTAGTVMVGAASTKLKDVAKKAKEDADSKLAEINASESLTEAQRRAQTAKVYARYASEFIKLYGPSAAVLVLSGASFGISHGMLKQRTAVLAAAATTIASDFKDYRKFIAEKYGEDVDAEAAHGIKETTYQTVEKDENGEEKVVEKTAKVVPDNAEFNGYEILFDQGCNGWDRDPGLTKAYLRLQEQYLTIKLRSRGYLFLNEIYELFGLPVTKQSRMVGWIYDPGNPRWKGDGYVDFGLTRTCNEGVKRFMNGYENCVWLNFNCDGYIFQDFERVADETRGC